MITKEECFILAGMFSVTNMGLDMPDRSTIAHAKKYPPTSSSSVVSQFCEQFIESDFQEAMFEGEVGMWFGILSSMSMEEIRSSWERHVIEYESA
jgi:hypothetical protein